MPDPISCCVDKNRPRQMHFVVQHWVFKFNLLIPCLMIMAKYLKNINHLKHEANRYRNVACGVEWRIRDTVACMYLYCSLRRPVTFAPQFQPLTSDPTQTVPFQASLVHFTFVFLAAYAQGIRLDVTRCHKTIWCYTKPFYVLYIYFTRQ